MPENQTLLHANNKGTVWSAHFLIHYLEIIEVPLAPIF